MTERRQTLHRRSCYRKSHPGRRATDNPGILVFALACASRRLDPKGAAK